MAILNNEDRKKTWAEFMTLGPHRTGQEFGGVVKADLRAAVDGLDDFLNTNAALINAAIPQPARGALTVQQKALLLQLVISRRYLRA